MLSRLALGALALSAALLGVARADPKTYCAPVTIDIFSVTASASGSDVEGGEIVQATGNDEQVFYYVPLPTNYSSPNVFFNIELTPNVTANSYAGLQSYGFSIQLNGVFAHNASGSPFFEVTDSGNVTDIEFINWRSARTAAVNNTLILNVSEIIQNPSSAHTTQCDYLYYFVFNNPAGVPGTGANIVGDPQFVGLRGQSYQVHGIDGAVYNIISEKELQVNSRFVFLNEGACPLIDDKLDTNCWAHPGSYLGEMSFQAIVDGKLHSAFIQTGSAEAGFALVQVDGKTLSVGDKARFGSFSVEVRGAYDVVVQTASFEFALHNSDNFLNQAIRSKVPLSQLTSHGMLGQTHSAKTYPTALKYIAGKVDDYLVESDDIFGSDFVFNKFQL